MNFIVRIFMGEKEISREELKNYAIRNDSVDRIINSIVDEAMKEKTFSSPSLFSTTDSKTCKSW